jgi:hypothetical protein
MKKYFKLFTFVLLFGFLVGCGGGGGGGSTAGNTQNLNADAPGAIPGLGDAGGDVVGETFTLPDGVEMEGGVEAPGYSHSIREFYNKESSLNLPDFNVIEVNGGYNVTRGSGGKFVLLTFRLRNTNAVGTEVIFPAGLVAVSTSGSQNGLLIKKTSVIVPANETIKVALAMYCANHYRGSSAGGIYNDIFIVISSSTLQPLFDLVANKRINIEEYTDNDKSTYWGIVNKMTDIVWHVTDGSGLTQSDIAYIESLEDSI